MSKQASQPLSVDPIFDPAELAAFIVHPDAVLLDARASQGAHEAYLAAHLPGARFVDLTCDLSRPVPEAAQGGRHPLPEAAVFAATLGRLGIRPDSRVLVYDDQGGAQAAARTWWMLRALGHAQVQVLDGGLAAAGLTLTANPSAWAEVAPYPATGWQWPLASLHDVDALRNETQHRVLDVRSAVRFRGEHEPIDPIAGHIPGAKNLPLSENFDAAGRFKAAAALRAQYEDFLGDVAITNLVVHCGSGVTACHTLLALERAGLHGARLYVGSWSEWCRHPELPRTP